MKLSSLRNAFFDSLSGWYPEEEIGSFFYLLLEEYLQLSRMDFALNPEKETASEYVEKFEKAIKRLRNHEPVQYIIGHEMFFDLKFFVSPATLIPRPETEDLVRLVLNEAKEIKKDRISILDIGTGTGCIAISIAKNLKNAEVDAMDVSESALEIAEKNAKYNEVKINFIEDDVLSVDELFKKYDFIISNPPYVRESEKERMEKNVLLHEPETALFVKDEDPLVFYRKITSLAKLYLLPHGKLFFEINEYLGEELVEMIEGFGFPKVKLIEDLYGKNRFIEAEI